MPPQTTLHVLTCTQCISRCITCRTPYIGTARSCIPTAQQNARSMRTSIPVPSYNQTSSTPPWSGEDRQDSTPDPIVPLHPTHRLALSGGLFLRLHPDVERRYSYSHADNVHSFFRANPLRIYTHPTARYAKHVVCQREANYLEIVTLPSKILEMQRYVSSAARQV